MFDRPLCRKIVALYMLSVKVKSQHTTFRCNVQCTSLTTSIETCIVFDLPQNAVLTVNRMLVFTLTVAVIRNLLPRQDYLR